MSPCGEFWRYNIVSGKRNRNELDTQIVVITPWKFQKIWSTNQGIEWNGSIARKNTLHLIRIKSKSVLGKYFLSKRTVFNTLSCFEETHDCIDSGHLNLRYRTLDHRRLEPCTLTFCSGCQLAGIMQAKYSSKPSFENIVVQQVKVFEGFEEMLYDPVQSSHTATELRYTFFSSTDKLKSRQLLYFAPLTPRFVYSLNTTDSIISRYKLSRKRSQA